MTSINISKVNRKTPLCKGLNENYVGQQPEIERLSCRIERLVRMSNCSKEQWRSECKGGKTWRKMQSGTEERKKRP